MKVIRQSYFKKPVNNLPDFESWINQLEKLNGYKYEKITIQTSLGKTKVYGLNSDLTDRETLVIFPGFRTTALIWDLDKGLASLAKEYRIFMVETNGQPNLSDGNTPAIKSLEYGEWGKEVFNALGIKKAFITGASFGGLVCMKISISMPERIKAVILLNPGCFRFVSFGYKNMYYNLLPMLRPNSKNIAKFLDKIIFHKPDHQISNEAEQHLNDYLLLAIKDYKDNTQKPYYMNSQLNKVKIDTYLMVGAYDILLPYKKSVANAKKHLGDHLKEVFIEKTGHGIELYPKAINRIHTIIKATTYQKQG